jgi:hypothetical protein
MEKLKENIRSHEEEGARLMAAIDISLVTMYTNIFETTKERQRGKFEKIRNKVKQKEDQGTKEKIDTNRWVVNLSDRAISDQEMSLLKHGLNYAVTPTRIPVEEYIAATEKACRGLNTEKAEDLRSDVVRVLKKHRKPKSNISLAEREALKTLKEDDSIMVLPADKGRCTVVMKKDEYRKKITAMLEDTTTYEKIPKDPTTKFKNKLVKKMKEWKDVDKSMPPEVYKRIYPTSETVPKFYVRPAQSSQN